MPRVSDAYRQARRDQIVAATLRVLARRSLHDLTMAHIIEESGLSAGSVYSHFSRKDELMELVAVQVIGERIDQLRAGGYDAPRSPAELVRWWLDGIADGDVPFGVLVQIWGEAASDPAMREIVQRRMGEIEAAFASAVEAWLASEGRGSARAPELAVAMLALCQGHIVRSAVLGAHDVTDIVAAVVVLQGA